MKRDQRNKWMLLAFLCGLFLVYTVDRAILGVLAIPIQDELKLSDVQFGLLSSGIFWTYALVVPFAGLVGDRLDRGRLIGWAAILWSAMTFCAGFADCFMTLFLLVSVAVVVPQTLYSPTANALISEHHADTRTLALSCHQAAYYTGWFISGATVAAVLAFCGSWRWTYFIFGGVGMALGAAFLLYGAPKSVGRDAPIAPDSHAVKPPISASLKAFFGCPTALLCAFAYIVEVFVGYGYSAWGPKFIAKKFGLTPGAAGTGVMFWHYAAAFVAILVSGWLTDRFIRRYPRFRLVFMLATQFVAAPMLVLFAFGPTLAAVWTAAAVFGLSRGAYGANQFAAIFDVVDSRYRAGALGFLNVFAGLIGSLAPIGIGCLSQKYGNRGFEWGFAALGASFVVAIAALLVAHFVTYGWDIKRKAECVL